MDVTRDRRRGRRGALRLLVSVLGTVPLLSLAQSGDPARVILVSGATGTQGGAVARELARRGFLVRGMTRDPTSSAAQALRAEGIEPVHGDFDDPATLERALAGAYGAFSVQQYRGIGVEAEIRQSKAFADAARRAGIRHFVYTSVAKAPLGTGVPQFDSKLVIEAYLREIGLPHTVVRPASFMIWLRGAREEALHHGVIRGPLPADQVRNYVAPDDIGRLVAEFFEDPATWLGQTIDLAGDAVSYAQVAEILSQHLGRPVRYEQIPWSAYVEEASSTEVARDQWYLEHDVATDVTFLRTRFPWLTTVEQYVATLP